MEIDLKRSGLTAAPRVLNAVFMHSAKVIERRRDKIAVPRGTRVPSSWCKKSHVITVRLCLFVWNARLNKGHFYRLFTVFFSPFSQGALALTWDKCHRHKTRTSMVHGQTAEPAKSPRDLCHVWQFSHREANLIWKKKSRWHIKLFTFAHAGHSLFILLRYLVCSSR